MSSIVDFVVFLFLEEANFIVYKWFLFSCLFKSTIRFCFLISACLCVYTKFAMFHKYLIMYTYILLYFAFALMNNKIKIKFAAFSLK